MSVIVNASTSTGLGITSDNSGSVEIQSNGTTKLTVASSGVSGAITATTAVASTSGNAIDFTNIPSWVKKITVMLNGVSTNGASHILIQIGSGSITTSGYYSAYFGVAGISAFTGTSSSGFILNNGNASNIKSGALVLNYFGSNIWVASGNFIENVSTIASSTAGSGTLSGTLDRIRITTVNGTDVFDAGSINIMYEG
jgi:hypothetical protein